jgi:hypothetical protein
VSTEALDSLLAAHERKVDKKRERRCGTQAKNGSTAAAAASAPSLPLISGAWSARPDSQRDPRARGPRAHCQPNDSDLQLICGGRAAYFLPRELQWEIRQWNFKVGQVRLSNWERERRSRKAEPESQNMSKEYIWALGLGFGLWVTF